MGKLSSIVLRESRPNMSSLVSRQSGTRDSATLLHLSSTSALTPPVSRAADTTQLIQDWKNDTWRWSMMKCLFLTLSGLSDSPSCTSWARLCRTRCLRTPPRSAWSPPAPQQSGGRHHPRHTDQRRSRLLHS